MYNLIYKLKPLELGTGLMSVNMEKTYPGLFRSFDVGRDKNIPRENRIWQLQNPYMYGHDCISRNGDYVFIRERFAGFFVGRKMTNGFSYLKRHRGTYKYYLPTVYQSNFGVSDEPSVGYYARNCRV